MAIYLKTDTGVKQLTADRRTWYIEGIYRPYI